MGLETHKIVTGTNVAKIAAQEVEDLAEVVIQLIEQRLVEVPQIQEEIKKIVDQYNQKPGGGRLKASELDEILKNVPYGNDTLYRVKKDIANEIGDLNRSLGELLTAKGREQYLADEGLFKDLFKGVHKSNKATKRRGLVGKKFDLFGSDLAQRLGAFESKLSSYTKAIKAGTAQFTVGHHQHLAGLRDLAVTVRARNDPQWWGEYVRRLNDMGYNPGDLGIVRVDPITHKPYSATGKGAKSIVGILGDVGITEKTPGFAKLEEALLARSAHAGGTGGVKIPALLATKTPEEAIELSKSWLEVEKGRSDQAVRMTSKLKSWQKEVQDGKFKNIDDAVAEITRRIERDEILNLGKGSPHDIEQKGIIQQINREAARDKFRVREANLVAPELPGKIATVVGDGKVRYKAPGIGLKDVKNLLFGSTRAGLATRALGTVSLLGVGQDLHAATLDAYEAIKDPTPTKLAHAFGSTVEFFDQTPWQIGPTINRGIRYTTSGGRKEFDTWTMDQQQASMSMLGEIPGTENYEKFTKVGLKSSKEKLDEFVEDEDYIKDSFNREESLFSTNLIADPLGVNFNLTTHGD